MKTSLYAGVAAVALGAGIAQAEQLTVFGPWLGPDQENVEAVLSRFAEISGHDVRYVGSDSFEHINHTAKLAFLKGWKGKQDGQAGSFQADQTDRSQKSNI